MLWPFLVSLNPFPPTATETPTGQIPPLIAEFSLQALSLSLVPLLTDPWQNPPLRLQVSVQTLRIQLLSCCKDSQKKSVHVHLRKHGHSCPSSIVAEWRLQRCNSSHIKLERVYQHQSSHGKSIELHHLLTCDILAMIYDLKDFSLWS